MPSGYHQLLSQLDPDSTRAALEFERLRRKLVRFFESRRASFPEDEADETIHRVARRLGSGVTVLDVEAFAAGTARRVLYESRRGVRLRLVPLEVETATAPAAAAEPPEPDPRPARLRKSLATLPRESRALLLAYYATGDDARGRIAARRRLAREWKLNASTLRTRVQRLRERVESELLRAS
jgi:DNA-directed RNA polymerase specialized sigma24 family protein